MQNANEKKQPKNEMTRGKNDLNEEEKKRHACPAPMPKKGEA